MADDIYRRITVRMWGDAKFRELSPLPPSGQSLWLVLLCGEQTGVVPGIFKIGEAAFAEQLGWSLEAFRDAFQEALSLGMVEADWQARLIWVPNAIRHNPPASLNTIKSWRTTWSLLPECELKTKSWGELKAFTEGMGEAWAKAFGMACPKPRAIQEAGNRKQKQETVQEPPRRSAPSLAAAQPPAIAEAPPEPLAVTHGGHAVSPAESGGSQIVTESHAPSRAALPVTSTVTLAQPQLAPANSEGASPPAASPSEGPSSPEQEDEDDKKATPEQKACRRAIAQAFADSFASRSSGGRKYSFTLPDRVAIKRWAKKYDLDATAAIGALREFERRMATTPFYAQNFCPAFIGSPKVLNALALPAAQVAVPARRPGAYVPLTGTSERFRDLADDGDFLGLPPNRKEAPRG